MENTFNPINDLDEYLQNDFNIEIYNELTYKRTSWSEEDLLNFLNSLYEIIFKVKYSLGKTHSLLKFIKSKGKSLESIYYLYKYLLEYINLQIETGESSWNTEEASRTINFIENDYCEISNNYTIARIEENYGEPVGDFEPFNFEQIYFDIEEEDEVESSSIPFRPQFEPERIQEIFAILKLHFDTKHHDNLLKIMQTGSNANEKLHFRGTGNSLAYCFGQLYDNKFITSVNKTQLQVWVKANFTYMKREKISHFTFKYLERYISEKNIELPKIILIHFSTDPETGLRMINRA